jgi:hypothetical protein
MSDVFMSVSRVSVDVLERLRSARGTTRLVTVVDPPLRPVPLFEPDNPDSTPAMLFFFAIFVFPLPLFFECQNGVGAFRIH